MPAGSYKQALREDWDAELFDAALDGFLDRGAHISRIFTEADIPNF
jgi:hypothetical protein